MILYEKGISTFYDGRVSALSSSKINGVQTLVVVVKAAEDSETDRLMDLSRLGWGGGGGRNNSSMNRLKAETERREAHNEGVSLC